MKHIEAFLNVMKADAALIHRPENMRWLSGYAGEGCLFITRDARCIVTDFRYIEQAGREASDWQVLRTVSGHGETDIVRELSAEHRSKTIYVETAYLTHDAYLKLEKALEGAELLPLGSLCEDLRQIKDADEIASIRKAADIACRAFMNTLPKLHAGMTERQARAVLEYEMLELGSEHPAFETIAAAGVNGALPHARPSDHVIQNGELLTFDFGATCNGYLSDITRTVGFGKIGPQLREIYETVRAAQQMGLDAIGPGKRCCDIDRVARDYIDARYPGAFGHSLGHGVGLFIHEQPRVSFNDETVLRPGHVVTVEPGVYIPGVGGCRIEDTVIMTEDGVINAMTAPKHLIEL